MYSYGDNITASLENNSKNCLRRIARNDDMEFSHQSILNAMEKFVKSVNTMDDTILVPCRLMDLKVGDENDPSKPPITNNHNNKNKKPATVQETLGSVDLFQIYNMLNNVKADLLWGQGQEEESSPSPLTTPTTVLTSTTLTPPAKGHVRRPSTVSVASTNSSASTISDSESDAGVENDSGIEEAHQTDSCGYNNNNDRTELVAKNFRRHLVGLTQSLRQMTEAAQYLTSRYQHDIGGPV